jgi:hypothetical protein
MSCNCQSSMGQAAQSKGQPASSNVAVKSSGLPKAQPKPAFVSVRYSGPTSTTATGPVSGRRYSFSRTGVVVQVDPRDKAAMAKVPHLRQV